MRNLLAVLLFSSIAVAQNASRIIEVPAASSVDERRQPADAALGTSLQAHGGAQILSIQTVILRGTSTAGKLVQPITVSANIEGSGRIDWGAPVNRSLVTTPKGRYEVREGRFIYRQPHSGLYSTLDVFSALGVRGVYASGSNRGIVGNVKIDGRDALRVHAGTDRQQIHYWHALTDEADVDLDSATGLIAAIHRREYADESLELVFVTTYTFSDYRAVGGIYLPFHIARYSNGRLKETLAVDGYDINPVFDRDFFER